jgi:hypothetical protein
MATLHLQVEIDSEVHPELHAVLSAIGKVSLRPERLRQLAAGGLIWEHLRAQPRLDAGAGAALAETARTADASALGRALARTHTAPPAEPAPAAEEPPVLQDVVEPAPLQSAARPRTRAAGANDSQRGARESPERTPPSLARATPEQRPHAVAADPEPAAATPSAGGAPSPAIPADGTTAKKSSPRSRLLLMRERGLFKDG